MHSLGHLPDELAQECKSAQEPALDDAQGSQCSCFLSTPCFQMLLHQLLLHRPRPGRGYCRLQHCPLECASRGICLIRLSRITTTSSKLGRLSGLGSQHLVTIFFSVCTRQCKHRSRFASPCCAVPYPDCHMLFLHLGFTYAPNNKPYVQISDRCCSSYNQTSQ